MTQLAPIDAPVAAYRFTLEMRRADGSALPPVPIEPDWDPAFETTAFEAMRRGTLPPVTVVGGSVQPVWHGSLGPPYLAAFHAIVTAAGKRASADIPTTYVRALARRLSSQFVEAGELQSGDVFTYRVCAYPAGGSVAVDTPGFAIDSVAEPLPLTSRSLAGLQAAARPRGQATEGEMPLFFAADVIAQAMEMSRRAGDVEVGGVLVGLLRHDATVPEIFVEVTGLIPAQHTVATATKVTFTAETWASVDAAIALRRKHESKIGWFHHHPNFCRKCPAERREVCVFRDPFFSDEDRHLHRVCFSRAHHIALLVTDTPDTGLVATAYGWSKGMVEERGFAVLPERTDRADRLRRQHGT